MAGKKGGKVAGKGGKQSKTARSSMPMTAKGVFITAPDMARIVPLNGGHHAYIRDLEGRTHRLATDSVAFRTLCLKMDTDGRMTNELSRLSATNPTWVTVATGITIHAAELAAAELAAAELVDAPAA